MVEMCIVALIMAFVSTAFLGILIATYKTNAKVTNMTDTITAVRLVKEKLGVDIREGRTLGDVYGSTFVDNGVDIREGTASFPGNKNPCYGAGQTPPAGWPWAGPPYALSNTCLVVQIPIGDNHLDSGSTHNIDGTKMGWPTAIYPTQLPAYSGVMYAGLGPGNPVVDNPWDNVETHIYQVLPDPNNAGEWRLEWCSVPGFAVPGYLPAAHSQSPQVLLTGIVGPLDGNGTPHIFQFIDKTDTTGVARDTILPSTGYVANYTGVVVNLEIRQHQESNVLRKDISVQPVGFKTEIFLRNNAIATTNGT